MAQAAILPRTPPEPADDAPHLLLVDDDRRIRDLLSRFLSGEGYRVTTAASAKDARAKLLGLHAGHDVVLAIFHHLRDAIGEVRKQNHSDRYFHRPARGPKAVQGYGEEVTRDESDHQVGHGIEQRAKKIQPQKLPEAHFHAAG